jgi:hypothetical protein
MSAVYPAWSSSTTYSVGSFVSYIGIIYRSLQTTRNNIPSTSPSFWAVNSPTPGGSVVSQVVAGNAISITGSATVPTVNNTGVVALVAGTNITLTPTVPAPSTGTAYTIAATSTGVQTVVGGQGIASTGGTNPSISVKAGAGLTFDVSGNVANTGVLTVSASDGCASTGGQNPNITNTGVLTVGAGNGISSTGGQNPSLSVRTGTGLTIDSGGNVANSGITGLTAGSGLISSGGQGPTLGLSQKTTYYTFDNFKNPASPTTTIYFPNNQTNNPSNYNIIDATVASSIQAYHRTSNNASTGITEAQIYFGPINLNAAPTTITSLTTAGYNQCQYFCWYYTDSSTYNYLGGFTLNPLETASISIGYRTFYDNTGAYPQNQLVVIVSHSISPATNVFE